jgi:uncharacterized membrane protein
VGTLASINHVHASLTQMAFFPPISLPLFTVNFAAITAIMAISFFSLTYALRKLAYTLAQLMVAQTATVLTESLKSMNNGTRGFYFAVAGLFLFAGPIISIVMTLGLSVLLYYRQGLSTEALAIERYVNAMIEEGIEG